MPEFGRLEAIDQRDRLHAMPSLIATRTKMFWITGPVLNQGSYPHCVGYAWKQFLQTTPRRTLVGPNGTDIYREAQYIDEWPGESYDGTSVRAGAKVLNNRSYLSEYVWGYSVDVIRDFVLMRGPAVLGSAWHQGMMNPDVNGWVYPVGPIMGGHAYVACGYSAVRNAFRCINSWGLQWGQKGKFWLHRDDLQVLLNSGGEACSAIEKKSALPSFSNVNAG